MLKNTDLSKILVVGFGNPLLDISVVLKDGALDLFERHNLPFDGQEEVNDTKFKAILDSLKRHDLGISYHPGGCALNTLRIIQALVKYPNVCVFFGGIGDDDDGSFIEEEVKKCGVEIRCAKHEEYPTGRVAALITGQHRCLVANLGAANVYNMGHFRTEENVSVVGQASMMYIEGFFITHSFEVASQVAELGHRNGSVIAFNISGAYVAENYPDRLISMVSVADIIIGNFSEFQALAKVMNLQYTSIGDLARQVHSICSNKSPETRFKFKLKHLENVGKTVVVTRGKDSVVAMNKDTFVECAIPVLDVDLIKDATGAGDAFAAGVLVGLLYEKTLIDCVSFGCKVAQAVIQQIGVGLPEGFQSEGMSCTPALKHDVN